jgi:hypothetical protein
MWFDKWELLLTLSLDQVFPAQHEALMCRIFWLPFFLTSLVLWYFGNFKNKKPTDHFFW